MEIFEAIKQGNQDAVEQLLAGNPTLADTVNSDGVRPLMLAMYFGYKELAAFLRQKSGPLNLWEAAALGDLDALKSLAQSESFSLDAIAPDGFTPLGLAAFFGRLSVLEWLLVQGADPNIPAQNPMAVCPIHSTSANRDPAAALTSVRLLVAYGAQLNVAQRGGWTPLHQAADHGHQEMVEFLLEVGADPSLKSADGRTPREMAAEKGFDQTAALLRQ